jgi:hypothetical protein
MAANVTYSAEFMVALDKLKEGVVQTQKLLNDTERKFQDSGKKGGQSYADNLTAAIDKFIPGSVKNITNLFESISPKLANAGKSAAMGFANAFGKLVPAVAPVFSALIASSGGLLLVIGAIALAIKGIASRIKKSYDEQMAFNKAVNAQKGALESARKAIASINKESETATKNYKAGERAAAAQHLIWKKIGDWFSDIFSPIIEGIKDTVAFIANGIGVIAQALHLVSEEEVTAAVEAQKLEKNYDAIQEASDEYARTLKEINMDSKKGDSDRLSAAQSYLDLLIQQRVLMAEKLEYEGAQIEEIDELIAAQTKERDILAEKVEAEEEIAASEEEITREMTDQEKIELARAKAEEKYLETMEQIKAEQAAGILTEKEAATARDAAMATWKDDLQAIVDEYDLTEGATVNILNAKRGIVGETEKQKRLEEDAKKLAEAKRDLEEDTLDIKEQLKQQEIDSLKAQAAIAETEEEKNVLLADALRLELELLDTQRAREKQAYMESDAFKLMYENNKDGAEEWEAAFNEATEGMKAALIGLKAEIKDTSSAEFDFNGLAQNIGLGLGYFQDAASSVMEITQAMAEDQIATIEGMLEAELEKLDEARNAALEAAGFVKATSEEGQAAAMEAAVASGDEAIIYAEKRRQEELAINKEFDDKEKAEKEKAARQIAEIQYQQAMADWTMKLAMAPAQIAQAVLQAISQFGPPPSPMGIAGIAMAGVIGALQIGALMAAMPKKPAFAGGGVIGLPQTYSGGYANGGIVEANTPRGVDAVDITAANREMILNDSQQSNLFNAISSGQIGGGGAQTVIVQLVVDGSIWAEQMVDLINNGATSPIQGRMIAQ